MHAKGHGHGQQFHLNFKCALLRDRVASHASRSRNYQQILYELARSTTLFKLALAVNSL